MAVLEVWRADGWFRASTRLETADFFPRSLFGGVGGLDWRVCRVVECICMHRGQRPRQTEVPLVAAGLALAVAVAAAVEERGRVKW